MTDKDSEVVISPKVYKSAVEAANVNKQTVSKFLEEAIKNQIEVRDEKKQMSILEKELEIINKRTKLVRDKAYERLSKIEEELALYKLKYKQTDGKLIRLKKKKEKLDRELKEKTDSLTLTEEALNSYKEKYDAAFSELEQLKEEHHIAEEDLKSKTDNLEKLEKSLNTYVEKYDAAYAELKQLKKDYKEAENELKLNHTEMDILTKEVEAYKRHATKIKDLVAENKEISERLRETGIRLRVARTDIRKFKDMINEYMPGVDIDEGSLNKIFSNIAEENKEFKHYKYKYEELKENAKRRYHTLAQNMPVGIMIIKGKNIEFYNDYLPQMLGYKKKEFKNLQKVLTKKSARTLKKHLKTKEERVTFDLEAITKKETHMFLEANLIRAQYSGLPGFILTLRDVTHQRELGDSKTNMENMKYYLKEKDEEIAKLRSELEDMEDELESLGKQKGEIEKERAKDAEELKKHQDELAKEKSKELKELIKKREEVPEEPLEEEKPEPKKVQTVEKKISCNAYIILTDTDGNISSLNGLVTSTLGYKIEDLWNEDEGKSAKDLKRPEMTQLLEDAENKQFSAIFIYKLDRFSRSLKDLILTIDKLKEWNIDFVSLQDKIETTSASGKLMFHIISAFAEFERNVTSERTTTAPATTKAAITSFRPVQKRGGGLITNA